MNQPITDRIPFEIERINIDGHNITITFIQVPSIYLNHSYILLHHVYLYFDIFIIKRRYLSNRARKVKLQQSSKLAITCLVIIFS